MKRKIKYLVYPLAVIAMSLFLVGCSDDEDDPGPEPKYLLSLKVNPEGAGDVKGSGEYHEGEQAKIDAIPEEGYVFFEWRGATDYVDDQDSDAAIVTMPTTDITLTAHFEMIDYVLTLLTDPQEGGTVNGEGTYNLDDEIQVEAIPNEGWQFISWTGDTTYLDDPTIVNTTVTMPAKSISLTANFQEIDDFYIIYGDGVTDIDDNEYITVIIGDQEWMAENLRVTRYSNGTIIPTGLNNSEWASANNHAYAIYDHNAWNTDGINSEEEMADSYGLLYNSWAALNGNGLCPEGWHVPSDDDWIELVNYVVDQGYPNEAHIPNGAGNALKSCRQVGSPMGGECDTSEHPRWNTNDTDYNLDAFGFSSIPGGIRWSASGVYDQIGSFGYYWTSSQTTYLVWARTFAGYSIVHSSLQHRREGFSVRCIKTIE